MKVALLALVLLLAAGDVQAANAPSRLQVVAREFSYSLSKLRLHPGVAVIELANFGQDAHDLRVQRVGGRHVAGTPVAQPGARVDLTVRLAPGRYSFWCSVADHRARGMRATLVVR